VRLLLLSVLAVATIGLTCIQDEYYGITLSGKFTNGPIAYEHISLKLGIEDKDWNIVSTAPGGISQIEPNQTKIFNLLALWTEPFEKCIIQIDSKYE
jgi:hypothetical protein